jgi:hypothetical protein
LKYTVQAYGHTVRQYSNTAQPTTEEPVICIYELSSLPEPHLTEEKSRSPRSRSRNKRET